jgi:DNA-binding transcriptional ArsR family regulator
VFEYRTLCPVFHALGDPTRMSFIEVLQHGNMHQEQFRDICPLQHPTVIYHLRALEAAGLLRSRKTGVMRIYSLRRDTLREAETCLRRLALPRDLPVQDGGWR